MNEKELDARAEATVEQLQPKMKERMLRKLLTACIQETLDEMVSEGSAVYDPDTERYSPIARER
jgi:hypothetical protein